VELVIEERRARSIVNVHAHADGPWFWSRYSARPYVGCRSGCAFCYLRGGIYLGRRNPAEFDTRIEVKVNAPELLDRALARLSPDVIVCGDWQQPVEERFGISRRMLEVVLAHGFPLLVVERSPLLLRDLDLLTAIHQRSSAAVLISLSSVDPLLKRAFEPRSPDVQARLAMLRALRSAGVPAGISLMPILPLVGDDEAHLEATIAKACEAGAQFVVGGSLTLYGDQARRTLAALSTVDEDGPRKLRVLYGERAPDQIAPEPPAPYAARIGRLVRQLCRRHGIADRMPRPILPGPLADNRRIAERLFLQAYELELAEASPYRVWAWRKAAWAVDECHVPIAELIRSGQLQQLAGVGPKLRQAIESMSPSSPVGASL
jgi:DNA repair photolyase